jgi:putative aldouronate transport system substrate-binding protein
MKKILSVAIIASLLVCSVFLSCSKDKNEANGTKVGTVDSAGWKENVATPVTFDWYINFSWFARKWGDSEVSKYITNKTGVNINFIVPAGNEAEKLNSMIAGETLPDIITIGWWESQVNMMIEAGLVEPLNKLAEEYDPYFFKVADAEKLGWYTKDDGNVYGYPNASYTPADYAKYKGKLTANETFLVRKDMYEAIGSPDMSTPDGFLAALRAAKEKFPKINGQEIIPLGMKEFGDAGCDSLQAYLCHFLAISPETNGKYDDTNLGINNPEYVRWLKTFRQAFDEGLIPVDVFVDKRSQIEEKAAQGRYFCMMYQSWDMQAAQNGLYKNNPNSVYIAVDGPKNSKGDNPRLGGGGISGWTITLISKNCKDKARAIQFLTYLISEEGKYDTTYGILGKTYNMVDGVPELTPEIKELDSNDKNKQETEIGVQSTYWMLMDTAWEQQWPIEYSPSLEQPQLWTKPYVVSYAQYDNLALAPGSDEALIYDTIQREWGKELPKLIMAKSDKEFDDIWNSYQQFKLDQGFKKVQTLQTDLLNKNKKKLGM